LWSIFGHLHSWHQPFAADGGWNHDMLRLVILSGSLSLIFCFLHGGNFVALFEVVDYVFIQLFNSFL
jgi:hypothetical protein